MKRLRLPRGSCHHRRAAMAAGVVERVDRAVIAVHQQYRLAGDLPQQEVALCGQLVDVGGEQPGLAPQVLLVPARKSAGRCSGPPGYPAARGNLPAARCGWPRTPSARAGWRSPPGSSACVGSSNTCAGRGDMRHCARCYSLPDNIVSIALIRTYILLTGENLLVSKRPPRQERLSGAAKCLTHHLLGPWWSGRNKGVRVIMGSE